MSEQKTVTVNIADLGLTGYTGTAANKINDSNYYWVDAIGGTCPSCGSKHIQYNILECLSSLPPQYKFRCICGHHWTSTMLPTKPNETVPKTSGLRGWICPVCGVGVAPHKDHCPCCQKTNLTPVWTCGGSITADNINYTFDSLSLNGETYTVGNLKNGNE